MDITYIKNNYSFQCRVSACIFNKEMTKLLVFQAHGKNVHLLVGGKMHEKEKSFDALKRELKEELGWEITEATFLAISEEFIPDQNAFLQQINFIYKVICNQDAYPLEFHGLEGDWITFKWIDIEEIDHYKIYPAMVKKMVRNPEKVYNFVDDLIEK